MWPRPFLQQAAIALLSAVSNPPLCVVYLPALLLLNGGAEVQLLINFYPPHKRPA